MSRSTPEFEQHVGWVSGGTELLLATLNGAEWRLAGAPTLLPTWDRATVLGHLARNADALVNLARWASTGVETPMYADPSARLADIERSALQSAAALVNDVAVSAARLREAMLAMPPAAWQASVRTATGRWVPASQIPWLRVRELWVHLVDLDMGPTFADLPDRLVDALLTEVAAAVGRKEGCPSLVVRATDRGRTWELGSGEGRTVEGLAADLLGWLLGRTSCGLSPPSVATLSMPTWL